MQHGYLRAHQWRALWLLRVPIAFGDGVSARIERYKLMTHKTTINGVEYSVQLCAGYIVDIYRGSEFAGRGRWYGTRIEDCAADLGDEVYDALDDLLATKGEGK